MKQLVNVKLVQFFLLEEADLQIDEIWGVFGPNGSGKSSLLDAIQIAMCGANERLIAFNAQADENMSNTRSIRTYCLGQYGDSEADRVRDNATTYISLVWKDSVTSELLTMGVCINASADRERFEVRGRYVLRGAELSMSDHLELVDGRRRPRAWETFRHQLLEQAKVLGEEPLHQDSEHYIRAALFALRGKGGIPQYETFVRSFRFALRMRFDKSVDQIVRNQVLESRPTNIKKFREVTDSFKKMSQMVAGVEAKIADLEAVGADFDRADQEHCGYVTWCSMAEDIRQSQATKALDEAIRQRDEAQSALEAANLLHDKSVEARTSAQTKAEHYRKLKENHQAHKESAELEADASQYRVLAQSKARELLQTTSALRRVVADASQSEYLTDTKRQLSKCLPALDGLVADNGGSTAQAVRDGVRPAISAIGLAANELFNARRQIENELDDLNGQLKAIDENLARGATGRAQLEGPADSLLKELRAEGLDPQPVCDLVEITDPDWQPVIEGYLGPNLQALLVRGANQERDAYRIYRGLSGTRAIFGAKVAMASRFEQRRAPATGSVAELIQGKDSAAVNYLRSKFGDAMRVVTNDESFEARHALTADGMLTTDGEVDRKPLVRPGKFKIGAGSPEQIASLRQEASRLRTAIAKASARSDRAKALFQQLQLFSSEDDILRRFAQACDQRDTALHAAEVAKRKLGETASADYLELVAQEASWATAAENAVGELQQLSSAKGAAETKLRGAVGALSAAERAAAAATAAAHAARAVEGYDRNLVAKRWDKLLEDNPDSDDAVLAACESAAKGCRTRGGNLATSGSTRLGQYIGNYKDPIFPDVQQDWRRARAWVKDRLQFLNDTTLKEYREQMDEAYRLSQATFRNDVALALHGNLKWLETTLNGLNAVLLKCPVFSNRERYQFKKTPRPAFESLLGFIENVAQFGPSQDLLGDAGELPQQFKELLDDKVAAGNAGAKSPLDDYREFFEFDIQILREDPATGERKPAGHLSKRLGSGSGGEHRAPLYVIAGAALASTYRLERGHRDGIRLILLDEAFNKMDMRNIIAAMRYLEDLGLQVVMASPGENVGTLTAFLHGYCDILKDAERNVIHLEPHKVTEQTRELFRADLPEFNPGLLDDEIRSLKPPSEPGQPDPGSE
jgi:chromosome segregation protein